MIPASPVNLFEYVDAISLSILGVVIFAIVVSHKRRTGTILRTISHTVAATPTTSLIFSVTMTICYPLYYAFLWLWLGPTAHVSILFYVLLLISGLTEMVFVWVPAHRGMQVAIHIVAAAVVGAAMLGLAIIILLTGHDVSVIAHFALWIFLVATLISFGLLQLQRYRAHTFAFETVYCILFLVAMSVVAHT